MPRRKSSKRGGKGKSKKMVQDVPSSLPVDDPSEMLEGIDEDPAEASLPEVEPLDPEVMLEDTESPCTLDAQPSPSLDGEHSKDGSGTESEPMHQGFMQTGPKTWRCGSTIIDLSKADDESAFTFKPSDIALEVECGDNKALMYLSKLYQGSKGHCIEFNDAWITPNEFQAISGRESAKDWKRSIRHKGRSFKLLLSKGVLDVHPAACRCDNCRLLQQSNGKTSSLDGFSGDESKKKSKGSSKKKKKGKEKVKERDKEQSGLKALDKPEVNGDLPDLNNSAPNSALHDADKGHNSSADSSSSSEDESSDEESDEEKKAKAGKTPPDSAAPGDAVKRVESIKVKIPRALANTNPQSSSSDSSSSGEYSSDDDSDDDGSSEEEEAVTIDPNGPLFPDLNPVNTKKPSPALLDTPAPAVVPPPPAQTLVAPVLKEKKESDSEDDEPLANINRKTRELTPTKQPLALENQSIPQNEACKVNESDGGNPGHNDLDTNSDVKVDVPAQAKEESMEIGAEKGAVAMETDSVKVKVDGNQNSPPTSQGAQILEGYSAFRFNPLSEGFASNPTINASADVDMREEGETSKVSEDTTPAVGLKEESPMRQFASAEPLHIPSGQYHTPSFTPGSGTIINNSSSNSNHNLEIPNREGGATEAVHNPGPEFLSMPAEPEPRRESPNTVAELVTEKAEEKPPNVPPDIGDQQPTEAGPDGEAASQAVDLSEAKEAPKTPGVEFPPLDSPTPAPTQGGESGGGGSGSESDSSRSIPAVPPLVPVAKLDRKPGGNKLSRLSNIIDNLRTTKEKQVLTGPEADSRDSEQPPRSPDRKESSPLPLPKPTSQPPQLVPRAEEKKGPGSSSPPPTAPQRHSSPLPSQAHLAPPPLQSPHPPPPHPPSSSSSSSSRPQHSPSPSQHSRKSSSSLPSSSAPHPHHGSSSSQHSSSHSGKSSKPSSSSSSSAHHSSTPTSSSSSRPPATSTPSSFMSISSMLNSSPSAATASPLLGASGTALSRHQQEQLALSLSQAMTRGMPDLAQAQALMAYQMQAEAAMQLHQANYLQKMSADMQQKMSASMSAQSKAERDYQMAMSALMPWPPRPDLLNPFHPLAHHHLLAVHQQQQLQQAQQMRDKELAAEKEKQKQQQKQREREQQQKREREREQQKQRQEQLERKHQQQKLQEQQQQLKQKQLQLMQEQQRKLDAAHSQFQRDVAKRSYEAMAASGLGLPGLALPTLEQPRKAHSHSDAKKARSSFPSTAPLPGKPRPSHTKENGSGGGGGGSGGSGRSSAGSSLTSSSLNLPMPLPVSPVAAPRMWSSCFPHPLPAPTLDVTHLSRLYGFSEEAAKHMVSAANATPSRTAHSAPSPASRQAHLPASTATASSSSSSAAASSTSGGAAGGGGAGGGGSGGEVLDLSVSKR